MKVLVLRREPGEDFWLPDYEGTVSEKTETHYKIRQFLFSEWLPKNGTFTKCQIIEENVI